MNLRAISDAKWGIYDPYRAGKDPTYDSEWWEERERLESTGCIDQVSPKEASAGAEPRRER